MIFEEVSWIRSNVHKFCPSLRQFALEWYRPFRFTPCFLQKYAKGARQRLKKASIIVQLHPDAFSSAMAEGFGLDDILPNFLAVAQRSKCKIRHTLPMIHSFTAKVDAKSLERLANDGAVAKIWMDRPVKAILDVASSATKARAVWQRDQTGMGIGVAILDTGIYPHKDLEGRIADFKDFVGNKKAPYDDNGHGTHVAGDVAGDGKSSETKYRGPAPGARLIGVKVLNKMGSGMLSTVIQGIQWCMDQKEKLGIRVMNISLGSSATQSHEEDPVCQAVEMAWDKGIVVCVAAGNEGPDAGTIASPGISPKVITVGALDDQNSPKESDYRMAGFSSRGPTIDGLTKPDVVSPGANIISLRSPNSTLDRQHKSARVGKEYMSLSGTSMATPICAGVVALILQANPELSPDQVKERLMATARSLPSEPENVQGKGLIDAEAAIAD